MVDDNNDLQCTCYSYTGMSLDATQQCIYHRITRLLNLDTRALSIARAKSLHPSVVGKYIYTARMNRPKRIRRKKNQIDPNQSRLF